MASRRFYLVAAALVSSTGILLWLGLGDSPPRDAGSGRASGPANEREGALGVRAADHDPAWLADEIDALPPEKSHHIVEDRPSDAPPPPPEPPAPPIVADAALTAQAAASAAAQPKVIAALRADFDARRDALRQTCWPPGTDYAATFTVESTFLEDGTMVSLGISDVPGMPDVGTCIIGQIGQKPPVLPEAPGVSVTVAVPIAFPGSGPPPVEVVDDQVRGRPRGLARE